MSWFAPFRSRRGKGPECGLRQIPSKRGRRWSGAILRVEELEARAVPSASVIDFSTGFNGNALTLNGAARYDTAKLQLTDGHTGEAASAFYSTPIHVSSFTTDFSFQLTSAAGDGFTFTIQGVGAGALGSGGAGLGYGGIANSVAVKFDLTDNAGEGPNSTGLYTNGANPTLPAINLANTGIDLHSGDVIDVHMTYDGSTLIVMEVDPTQQATATQSYAVNIASVIGSSLGYVGFTAASGSLAANQEILGWSYTETNLKPDLGINISNVVYYNQDVLFADAMKESGGWGSTSAPWDLSAKVDANGWPLQDAGVTVLSPDGGAPNGTYRMSFTGQAAQITPVACSFTVQNKTYNAATNTTTANVLLNNQVWYQTGFFVAFTGTKRNPTDNPGTGITNLKMMLPVAPGSTTSYDPSVTFTNQIKSLVSKFSTVRYMDYLATNGNQQVNWSDRLLPGGNQYQAAAGYGWEGKGASWEYAVQLANETHTDMWINIPVNASADYITKVANLIRYGSDGVNPYTSNQANPVYKGLDPGLKVYIEYSNEIWNSGFSQSQDNANAAAAEVAAGASPLNYDGSTDSNVWTRRRVAEKIVQISDQFRAVFGDAQMGSRIRPVLEWFHGNTLQTASDALNFLNNYYDNADGV
ncbi:MAG TPA: L-type lectin-domain containing protein, partial [Gemmataceae bacterium]|nr:L-type lectin-domain containing protein [Gemmataceae bacterium]